MPRPAKYVSRSDLGWGTSPAAGANPRSGLVIHYDSSDQRLADKPHSACVDYWRRTRDFHINGNGWVDLGYSFGCCSHGYVFEGRGLFKAQAAQPGGNTTYYSCTLMTGPTDEITPAQIEAVRALRAWLMEPESSIAGTVKGHRDFIATSCPGDKAYALVKDGTFSKAPSGSFEEDDDMPKHRRFEKRRDQVLQPGEWASLAFTATHDGQTGEYYSLVGVDEPQGALYDFSVGVTIEGLAPGAEVQLRATEYEPDGDGGWEIARNRPIDSPVHVAGNGHFAYSWKGNLGKGRRVRVRLVQYGDAPATVTSATADVFYWPK